MLESKLEHCLLLCRQVQAGADPAAAEKLEQLLHSLSAPVADPLPMAQSIIEQLAGPMITLDLAGYITGWNQAAVGLLGYEASEAIGQNILFLSAAESDAAEFLPEPGSSFIEVRRRKKSGEVFRARMSLSTLQDAAGENIALIIYLNEIIETPAAVPNLPLLAGLLENCEQGLLVVDAGQRIVAANVSYAGSSGYTLSELIGQQTILISGGSPDKDFARQVSAALLAGMPWQGEILSRRKSGELLPESVSLGLVRDGGSSISHVVAFFSDIGAWRQREERMRQQVSYDSLTGLPNRSLFHQLVVQALASARRNAGCGAILAINLNRFSAINDGFGHEIGDQLLCQVAQRLRLALRDEDILARGGGDEFVVALLNIQKREHGGIVAQKLIEKLRDPFVIAGQTLYVGASVGISVYPEDGLETSELLGFADTALKRAKADEVSDYFFYSSEMNQRAKAQWQLESELRQALGTAELQLHYQPKVSLRSGLIVGAEALIRWQHPVHGSVSPGKFIPVAEETGLILEIGHWVLEEACRQVRAWIDAASDMPPIAVNLSARQFDPQLPARIQTLLERYAVPPDRIRLEITESLLVRGAENVIAIMNELVAMGLALALDDFGTGYSSLAYLKKFPISTLKIDRSFVIGVPAEENDCAIAQAIVTMGQQLRQEIVAEGVESMAQVSFLRDLGCDQLQGFLFSPAVTASEFARMVRVGERLQLA